MLNFEINIKLLKILIPTSFLLLDIELHYHFRNYVFIIMTLQNNQNFPMQNHMILINIIKYLEMYL